ncbi:hypothetical protein DPMN_157404 [Dreissena polymorpha]|uniref:Uncharacterized protein n=1 Tax=Dreissena polymorpha TaxID=45954 RepID=A0A9D4IL14_DREPO|nr:hypothetical protein DPMN_157404 [Dreissena polymorpha]
MVALASRSPGVVASGPMMAFASRSPRVVASGPMVATSCRVVVGLSDPIAGWSLGGDPIEMIAALFFVIFLCVSVFLAFPFLSGRRGCRSCQGRLDQLLQKLFHFCLLPLSFNSGSRSLLGISTLNFKLFSYLDLNKNYKLM